MNEKKMFSLRKIEEADQEFLFEMQYQAIFVPKGTPSPDRAVLDDPSIRRYVEDWGRPGDFGLVAVDTETGEKLGAVWLRYFDSKSKGYGYVSDSIPELAIAVEYRRRGEGIGTVLLHALLEEMKGKTEAISLSVDLKNPAVRLYKRFGFVEYDSYGESMIMVCSL